MLFLILILVVIFFFPIIILNIYDLIYRRAYCKSKVCLLGKTALVTGGCSGIGYQVVLGLASRGCRVIIADKIEDPDLKKNIFKETHSTNIDFKYVDFSSFKSVREFAAAILKSEDKIDILVNNAGIASSKIFRTEDGLDEVLQVNYFSPFLLTHLLIGLLKKSQSGRIIFTSSVGSFLTDFTLDNLRLPTDENYWYHYSNSKLGLIVISDLFAKKLKDFKVTSNSFHPGIVYTNIYRNASRPESKINAIWLVARYLEMGAFLVGKRPEAAAQTAIYLACANEVEEVTGKFFYETKEIFKPWKAYNKRLCRDIWNLSEELVKLQPHEKI